MSSSTTIVKPSEEQVVASIAGALSMGQIGKDAAEILTGGIDNIAIGAAAGIGVDSLDSEEATLVAIAFDGSGSMYGHRHDVIDGYNKDFLAGLRGSKAAKQILISTWVFSGDLPDRVKMIHGYTDAASAPELNEQDYEPNSSTPLYLAIQRIQQGMVSYGQTLRDNGTRTKCIIVVFSDGEDNDSEGITANAIKVVSDDLIQQEYYILSYVFFGDEAQGNMHMNKIGFPERHGLTGLDPAEIRKVLGEASASVVSKSQGNVSSGALSANPFFVTP